MHSAQRLKQLVEYIFSRCFSWKYRILDKPKDKSVYIFPQKISGLKFPKIFTYLWHPQGPLWPPITNSFSRPISPELLKEVFNSRWRTIVCFLYTWTWEVYSMHTNVFTISMACFRKTIFCLARLSDKVDYGNSEITVW